MSESPRTRATAWALALALALSAGTARAFSYVVAPGDTLASIAERYYGRIQQERLLVALEVGFTSVKTSPSS